MKKICLFLFLVCCFGISNANAAKECRVTTCPKYLLDKIPEEGVCTNENCREYIRSFVGGTQCYSCDSNDDSINGDQCPYKKLVGQRDREGNIIGIYECVDMRGTYDGWSEHNPTLICKNSIFRNGAPKSSYNTYYLLKGEESKEVSAGDHMVIPAGSDGCVYYVCKTGFVPNADKTDCVSETEDYCSVAGGKWVENTCDCTPKGKYFEWDDSTKKCVDKTVDERSACIKSAGEGAWIDSKKTCDCTKKGENYEWNKKSCELNQAGRDLENARALCIKTGGNWFGGICSCNKTHMKDLVKGKTCQCESDAYVLNKDKHVCEITDLEKLKQNCEKAAKNSSSGVEGWDGVSKCTCKQSNEMYNFDGESKCVQDERYKLCATKSNEAYWNRDEDKCVCTDKDFEWNYNRCDKKGEVVIAENEANATKQITTLVDGLKTKFASFEKSVWKDKEGNFNKARLASDSIAGVVLGTAGGLITSKVVKKNQVKSGFEDINCVIGGQKVADYGDEFTVGIK